MPDILRLPLQFFAEDESAGVDDSEPTNSEDTPPEDPAGEKDKPQDGKTFDEDYVKALRRESAKYRTKYREMETKLNSILKALGQDEGEPDPEQLKQQLEATQRQLRELKVESTFGRVAHKVGADVELTLAVLKTNGSLDELDPDSETFAKDLEKLIKKAIESNPKLKASQPGKTGAEMDGQGGKTGLDMNTLIRRKAGF